MSWEKIPGRAPAWAKVLRQMESSAPVYAETGSEDQNDEKRNLGGGQETGQVG